MAIEIIVPRLGWSMEEGIFGAWLKEPGEWVFGGEPLFSLESDKVTMDVEALDAGTLYVPVSAPGAGDAVKVGQLLGYLLDDGEAAPAAATPTPASPRARALARTLGIDLADVTARPGKRRVVASDVERVKPSGRSVLAARLEESFRAPHFYLHADADAEALSAYREGHRPLAYNDILLQAISLALTRHPRVNAYWSNGAVALRTTRHVALAAQIGDQLLTPVIRNPAEKSLTQITSERLSVLDRCRNREARPEDFADASATLSNLGPFGVDRFQAILNPPQSIIVAAGQLKQRPVVFAGQVAARLTLPISLSVDHRVVDGVAAAAFLHTLIEIIEDPRTLIE